MLRPVFYVATMDAEHRTFGVPYERGRVTTSQIMDLLDTFGLPSVLLVAYAVLLFAPERGRTTPYTTEQTFSETDKKAATSLRMAVRSAGHSSRKLMKDAMTLILWHKGWAKLSGAISLCFGLLSLSFLLLIVIPLKTAELAWRNRLTVATLAGLSAIALLTPQYPGGAGLAALILGTLTGRGVTGRFGTTYKLNGSKEKVLAEITPMRSRDGGVGAHQAVVKAAMRRFPWVAGVAAVLIAAPSIRCLPAGFFGLDAATLGWVSLGTVGAAFIAGLLFVHFAVKDALTRKNTGRIEKEAIRAKAAKLVGLREGHQIDRLETGRGPIYDEEGNLVSESAVTDVRFTVTSDVYSKVTADLDALLVKHGLEDFEASTAVMSNEITLADHWIVLVRASEETKARRAILAASRGLVVGAQVGEGRVELELAQDSPAAADRVAAFVTREYGMVLTTWDPYNLRAVAEHLDEEELALRNGYADRIKGAERHMVSVGITRDDTGNRTITVSSLALAPFATEARDKLALELRDATPGAAPSWGVSADPVSGTITLVEREDVLRAITPYPRDAKPDLISVPFAVAEDGTELRITLTESNVLLGGLPGGGKSGGSTALLAGISQLENVALIGLDPKRVELSPWRPRFSVVAKPVRTQSPEDDEHAPATAVLGAIVEEMHRRYEWLDERGLKKVTARELSPTMPLLVVVIDELADLVSVAGTREGKAFEAERATYIRRLIALGRASGVAVITATQKPQSDVIPTALRDLIQQRAAYATTNPSMTDVILGHGMSQTGGLSHEIAASQKGVAYVVNESSRTPVRARTYWVPDDEVAGLAQATAHLRVDLPWLDEALSEGGSSSGSKPSGRSRVPKGDRVTGRIIEEPPAVIGEDEIVDYEWGGEALDLSYVDFDAITAETAAPAEPDPWEAAAAARAGIADSPSALFAGSKKAPEIASRDLFGEPRKVIPAEEIS